MAKFEPKHCRTARYFGEFLGTFFLVLTIGFNVLTGSVAAALSIGTVLMLYVIVTIVRD